MIMNIKNGSNKTYTVQQGRLYNGDGNPYYFNGIKDVTVYFPEDPNNGKQLKLMYFPNGNRVSNENRFIAAGNDNVVFELLPDGTTVTF